MSNLRLWSPDESVTLESQVDDLAYTEWQHWLLIAEELRNLNIDPTVASALIHSIALWGEHLAQLRRSQTPELCAASLSDKLGQWQNATGRERLDEIVPR